MIYNVSQLMKSAPGTTVDEAIDGEDAQGEDYRFDDAEAVGPANGRVRLNRTNQGVFADGIVAIPTRLQCARCLKDFTTTITFPVREEFFPTIDVVTGAPIQTEHGEDAFPIDRHHQLDLREAIRQNYVVALPSRALCREDCAGLCPQCGRDLNDGPCDCVPERLDDRFSVLNSLFADAGDDDLADDDTADDADVYSAEDERTTAETLD